MDYTFNAQGQTKNYLFKRGGKTFNLGKVTYTTTVAMSVLCEIDEAFIFRLPYLFKYQKGCI